MNIRPAIDTDFPLLVRLGKLLFEQHRVQDAEYYKMEEEFDSHFSRWLTEQITIPNRFVFTATEEDSIRGFISGYVKYLFPWLKIKSVGHISFLVIDPVCQRKGIGRKLLDHAEQWFAVRNLHYVELYVEESNLSGLSAWDTYGFSNFKKFLRKNI